MDTMKNKKKSMRLPYQTPKTKVDNFLSTNTGQFYQLLQTSIPISDDDKIGEWSGEAKKTDSTFGDLW